MAVPSAPTSDVLDPPHPSLAGMCVACAGRFRGRPVVRAVAPGSPGCAKTRAGSPPAGVERARGRLKLTRPDPCQGRVIHRLRLFRDKEQASADRRWPVAGRRSERLGPWGGTARGAGNHSAWRARSWRWGWLLRASTQVVEACSFPDVVERPRPQVTVRESTGHSPRSPPSRWACRCDCRGLQSPARHPILRTPHRTPHVSHPAMG